MRNLVCIHRRNDDHHKDRGFDPKGFLDNSVEIRHAVQKLEGHGIVAITTDAVLFLANLGQDFGVISQVLEGVDQATAHSVLAGEQEREEDHSHFAVTEFPAALPLGILDRLKPTVKHAGGFTAVCHMDLALGSSFNEPLEGNLTGPNGPPDFCSRQCKGKVDKFEGPCDIPVFVTDFLGGDCGDVISTKYAQRGVHVEMAGDHHDGMSLSISGNPIAEVLAGDFVLNVKIEAAR